MNPSAPINSLGGECGVTIARDGLTLVFSSGPTRGGWGGYDLWMCSRLTTQEPWGLPANLGATVNSSSNDCGPCLSPDGLALFFRSDRGTPVGQRGIWMTTRRSRSDPWRTVVKLNGIINNGSEWNPGLSADGKTLYFCSSQRGGGDDIFAASILPNADFNHDGKVDLQDLQRLLLSWGLNDPLVDIGPMPWGDGKVDIEDVKVLVDQWTPAAD